MRGLVAAILRAAIIFLQPARASFHKYERKALAAIISMAAMLHRPQQSFSA